MAILTTQKLGKYFGGQDIFSDISVNVHHGERIALIGPNGTGKTTLLQILSDQQTPTAGTISKAKTVQVGYLEQHASLQASNETLWEVALGAFTALREQEAALQAMEAALATAVNDPDYEQKLAEYGEAQSLFDHAGGYQYEQKIDVVLTGLGFSQADYETPTTQLSGGQQSRAQLARLLLEQPNLLMLDEPTNHLDLASVEWLEGYLQQWPGAMIVVSHDRYFLDKVSTHVWELNFGKIESYRGNFSHYLSQRAERQARQKKEFEAQQTFIKKEEAFIQRNIAGQRTREAQGRRKRLARLDRVESVQHNKSLHLNLQTALRSGDLVLATHEVVVGYPDHDPLFNCPDLEIRRGDCVALLGPNGSGKTTFVKTILRQLKPLHGNVRFGAGVEVGYYAQTHASLTMDATILDEILSLRNMPIAEARNYLGQFLFMGDDVFKMVGTLSGGERSRVALAKLALSGANFLILDEPTNHLDIPSQETLEMMLANFDGTILLVSHDRYFVDALANFVWAIEPEQKTVMVTEGGYSDYLAVRVAQQTQAIEKKAPQKGKILREQNKAAEREARQQAKKIADIEALIADTETHLAELASAVEEASRAQDVSRLQQLGQDYQATEEKLDQLLTQWTELESETI